MTRARKAEHASLWLQEDTSPRRLALRSRFRHYPHFEAVLDEYVDLKVPSMVLVRWVPLAHISESIPVHSAEEAARERAFLRDVARRMKAGADIPPVLLRNGHIHDGRHRTLAAKMLGLQLVPVVGTDAFWHETPTQAVMASRDAAMAELVKRNLELLSHPHPAKRQVGIYGLASSLGKPQVHAAVEAMLQDEDPSVRAVAAEELANYGGGGRSLPQSRRANPRESTATVIAAGKDAIAAARSAGARGRLDYLGAGMTGVVLGDAYGRAFKVARNPHAGARLEEEADWLAAAARVPSVAEHVSPLRAWYPDLLVLVKDRIDGRPGRWDDDPRLWGKLAEIDAVMRKEAHWSGPERKPDSWIVTPDGRDVLVDAGMAFRMGPVLVAYAEEVLRGERPLADPEDVARELLADASAGNTPRDEATRLVGALHAMTAAQVAGRGDDEARGHNPVAAAISRPRARDVLLSDIDLYEREWAAGERPGTTMGWLLSIANEAGVAMGFLRITHSLPDHVARESPPTFDAMRQQVADASTSRIAHYMTRRHRIITAE